VYQVGTNKGTFYTQYHCMWLTIFLSGTVNWTGPDSFTSWSEGQHSNTVVCKLGQTMKICLQICCLLYFHIRCWPYNIHNVHNLKYTKALFMPVLCLSAFNTSCQLTPLLNLCSLTFSLTFVGWFISTYLNLIFYRNIIFIYIFLHPLFQEHN